jgi:Predicted glycosyltransferases
MNSKEKKVAIIILCHNSKRWLKECIETVINTEYSNYIVIIVDNASDDASIEEIKNIYSNNERIVIIRNEKNLGWCKGNNIGIDYAIKNGADYVYLSNSDVRFHKKNWLKFLVVFMEKHSDYDVTGPVQYNYENGYELNEWTEYIMENGIRDVHYMWSNSIKPVNKDFFNYTKRDFNKEYLPVYFIQGAAMLIRVQTLKKIGLFDEIYYIFYDELDFCRRVLRTGGKVALIPQSGVQHYGSGDNNNSVAMIRKKNFYFARNKYIYLLSDYKYKKCIKREMLHKWIMHDIKQCFLADGEINDFTQMIQIIYSLCKYRKKIKIKRKEEYIMERKIIEEKVLEAIGRIINNSEVNLESNLLTDYSVDSIQIMEMIINLEEMFGIKFDEDVDFEDLYSPLFIVNYIIGKENSI